MLSGESRSLVKTEHSILVGMICLNAFSWTATVRHSPHNVPPWGTQGKHGEAKGLCMRSLAINEKVQGQNHPDVATSLNSLASLLHSQVRVGPRKSRAFKFCWCGMLGVGHTPLSFVSSPHDACECKHMGAQDKCGEAAGLYRRSLVLARRCYSTRTLLQASTC